MLNKLLNSFGLNRKASSTESGMSFRDLSQMSKRAFGFPAASSSRLLDDWPTTNVAIDSILRQDLIRLRPRARSLAIKNPYFAKYLSLVKSNVIGPNGMVLKNKAMLAGQNTLDKQSNAMVQDNFEEWSLPENCTVSKDMSLREVGALMMSTICTDGEVLVRKVRGKQAGNKFGFALQVLECDVLDIERNFTTEGGNIVKMGVEKTELGKRVAYHCFKSNPSDTYYPSMLDTRWTRIDANDMLHAFIPFRPSQTRGFPWAAAVMIRTQMLEGYEEGALVRMRATANKHGFLKTTGDVQYEGTIEDGVKIMDSEPGSWEQLPAGIEPVAIDFTGPSAEYDPYVKNCLRGIASGLLVSYPTLANDYGEVNFSAGRMSQMEERDVWLILQHWFADHVLSPIFSDWLEMNLATPHLPLPYSRFDKFNKPCWHGRRWLWVDPQKEINAIILALNAGVTSITRELAYLGIDRDELLDEIQSDKEAMASRKIELPELYQAIPALTPKPQLPNQKTGGS